MAIKKLPPELLSLLHYVAINESDWWTKAVQKIILAAVWLEGKPIQIIDTSKLVSTAFGVDLPVNRLRLPIDFLSQEGSLVKLDESTISISEKGLETLEKELNTANQNEKEVKELFMQTVKDACPKIDGEQCWNLFIEQYLIPLVKEFGARTYELVSGTIEENMDGITSTYDFFDSYKPEDHLPIRSAIAYFLNPKNVSVRKFVLSHVQAYFLVEAAHLDEKTVNSLIAHRDHKPSFKMFLDTNFLFSMLDLHVNPSNEASKLLVDLLGSISEQIDVKLYVHPLTMEEAKRVLFAVREDFRGVRLNPAMAEAAIAAGLSGVALKFAQVFQESGKALDPDDYFSPYLTNLSAVIRGKGIEIYNEKYEVYLTRQDVIDDIDSRLRRDTKGHPETASQTKYKAIEHDCALWHIVTDHRPSMVESPLDAQYWIITNDYTYLRYDLEKRKGDISKMSACLHPSEFVQMLQIWEPRSTKLEEALLGTLRLPFLFFDYDVQAEKVTLRILRTISRFENAGDLKTETISEILTTKALRKSISTATDSNEELKLVREVMIEKNIETQEALHQSMEQVKTLEKHLDSGKVQRESLEHEVVTLRKDLSKVKDENGLARLQSQFIKRWIYVPFIIAVPLVVGGSFVLLKLLQIPIWQGLVGTSSLSVLVWIFGIGRAGKGSPVIAETAWYAKISKIRNFVYIALITILLGVVTNMIWDFIKA